MSWQPTRRELLLCLAALGAAPVLGCAGEDEVLRLAHSRVDAEAASRVGRAWLADRPEATPAELARAVCGDDRCPSDPSALRLAIAERHRLDFRTGRIESVDGWILSRTEATLCALVALLA